MNRLDEDLDYIDVDKGQYDALMAHHARRNPAYAASGREPCCPRCGYACTGTGCHCQQESAGGLRKNPAPDTKYRLQDKRKVLAVLAQAKTQGGASYLHSVYPQVSSRAIHALLAGQYVANGNDIVVVG